MSQPSGISSPEIDPIEAPRAPASAPPPPAGRPKRGGWRKWRARFIVLVLLAAAVLLFLRISSDRSTESNRVNLKLVTLTAQVIPIQPLKAGTVTSVAVSAEQQVTAGQRLGTMDVVGADKKGDPKTTRVVMTAPRSGVIIDVPAPIGSTVQPGQSFLQMYDPAQMTFVSEVPLKELPNIAPTMSAVLHLDGVKRTVHATVQRIVPRVAGAEANSGTSKTALQVVFAPASAADVAGLVPGLRFTGYIKTLTGTPGSSRLVSLPDAALRR